MNYKVIMAKTCYGHTEMMMTRTEKASIGTLNIGENFVNDKSIMTNKWGKSCSIMTLRTLII